MGDYQPGAWMELPIDHEILEVVDNRGSVDQEENFKILGESTHQVRNRVQLLCGYGLLEKHGSNIQLTRRGEQYLAGKIKGDAFEMSGDQ